MVSREWLTGGAEFVKHAEWFGLLWRVRARL